MVTTLGAAFAAAAVAVVAVSGFLMVTFCAEALVLDVAAGSSISPATPAPAPPPMSAPATRPAMPMRMRPARRDGVPAAMGSGALSGADVGCPP
jgi:hypothetical protein